jgi:DNA-binding response OmpR family regulator
MYREMIYEQVWDSPYMGDSRTVDLHVQRLRKKAGLEHEIEAVYKVGYRFRGSV